MADTGNGTNGNVTLAEVRKDIQYLTKAVDKMNAALCGELRDHEGRLRSVEKDNTANTERWTAHHDTHKSERNVIAGLGSLATLITGSIAWFK